MPWLPQAVGDWLTDRRVGDGFYQAIWEVIHGDALAADDWTPAQTQTLLNAISMRISSPMNVSDVARSVGEISRYTVNNRLHKLEQNYLRFATTIRK